MGPGCVDISLWGTGLEFVASIRWLDAARLQRKGIRTYGVAGVRPEPGLRLERMGPVELEGSEGMLKRSKSEVMSKVSAL